uniref:Uncharacterized protein n=1 Tax=Cacopsylla melanoneura TaxID=428564 RepID=A0A8D9ERV1_9HEMI
MMTSLKSTLSSPVNKKTRDFYRKPLRSNSRKTKNSSRLRLSILFNLLKTITRKINDNLKLSKALLPFKFNSKRGERFVYKNLKLFCNGLVAAKRLARGVELQPKI